MNAPCGHREAECIVGSFWLCRACETKPAETVTRWFIPAVKPSLINDGNFLLWRADDVPKDVRCGTWVTVKAGPLPKPVGSQTYQRLSDTIFEVCEPGWVP